MNPNLQLQELAISIKAKDLNPTVINPDFLKYTGIVPNEWECQFLVTLTIPYWEIVPHRKYRTCNK